MTKPYRLKDSIIEEMNNKIKTINLINLINEIINNQPGRQSNNNLIQLITLKDEVKKIDPIKKIEIFDESRAKHDPFHMHVTFKSGNEASISLDKFIPLEGKASENEIEFLKIFLIEGKKILEVISDWERWNMNTKLHNPSRIEDLKKNIQNIKL